MEQDLDSLLAKKTQQSLDVESDLSGKNTFDINKNTNQPVDAGDEILVEKPDRMENLNQDGDGVDTKTPFTTDEYDEPDIKDVSEEISQPSSYTDFYEERQAKMREVIKQNADVDEAGMQKIMDRVAEKMDPSNPFNDTDDILELTRKETAVYSSESSISNFVNERETKIKEFIEQNADVDEAGIQDIIDNVTQKMDPSNPFYTTEEILEATRKEIELVPVRDSVRTFANVDKIQEQEIMDRVMKKADGVTDEEKIIQIAKEETALYMNEQFRKTGTIITNPNGEHFDLTYYTGKEVYSDINNLYSNNITLNGSRTSDFGMRQSMFMFSNKEQRGEIAKEISIRYGISEEDAAFVLSRTYGGAGNCSVATAATVLEDIALRDPARFKTMVGEVPMVEYNGTTVINAEGMYITAFMNDANERLIKNIDGKIEIDRASEKNPNYGVGYTGFNEGAINKLCEEKDLGCKLEKTTQYKGKDYGDIYRAGYSDNELATMAQDVKEALDSGKIVTFGFTPKKDTVVTIISEAKLGQGFNCEGDHIMRVLDVTATGFVCDTTWGAKGVVEYSELQKKMPNYTLDIMEIVEIGEGVD